MTTFAPISEIDVSAILRVLRRRVYERRADEVAYGKAADLIEWQRAEIERLRAQQ